MITISRPLSAAQARHYHAQEFGNGRENYYTQGDEIRGEWHGRLAQDWDLMGAVDEVAFARLAEGHHPTTDEALVRHQAAHVSTNARGESVQTMGHRAGWDATFSAPKSVSLTALVGGDDRVREAHRESVQVALDELEQHVQARLGGNRPAETTGRWVAASFEHDSARPVDGYAAPQLHTHVVFFNLTKTHDGDVRPLQPREIYKTQQLGTAIYRAELAVRLKDLGYEIDRGKSGQPEIHGYTEAYLAASSPRRQQIQEHLDERGLGGAGAAQIAAHQTREPKVELSHDEMQARHQEMARQHGHQPEHVVAAAQERVTHDHERARRITPSGAVTFAVDRNLEREAVVDERSILRDALTRGMGDVILREVRDELDARREAGELVHVEQTPDRPGRSLTSKEMIDRERSTIAKMHVGQGRHEALGSSDTAERLARQYPHLNEGQRTAVQHVLASRDQTIGLDGVAGAGKTTTLTAIRDLAEARGYDVSALAPTSRATHLLADAGIPSVTLQRHLAQPVERPDGEKHLYVLDESSLASTRQMHTLLAELGRDDRVLLVGDTRQHHAVEAGRPYQQLQNAGMDTARLADIIRQQDPGLRVAVEHLSRGEVGLALGQLEREGRVHQIADHRERLEAIAHDYVRSPDRTLVVSPDNQSRREINAVIHRERQIAGQVDRDEQHLRVLVPRQDLTGVDRQWAARYDAGDVVRYTTGSRAVGVAAGEYARVEQVDASRNRLTVARDGGEHVTYDPRRLHGVTVYREEERAFSAGDRVQVTAPDRERQLANRELGTVETSPGAERTLQVRLDSGRTAAFERDTPLHLDYGYAVTSHSSQGQTADRVLVHVDTDRAGEALVNRRFAYVALSRSRYDAHVYTNDRTGLAEALGREHAHRSALEPVAGPQAATNTMEKTIPLTPTIEHGFDR